jgi:hypothetical protein
MGVVHAVPMARTPKGDSDAFKVRSRRRGFQQTSPQGGAPCQSRTPALFFRPGERPWVDAEYPGAYDLARRLCASCAWRQWCLASALDHHESYGVWGGTTPAERAGIIVARRAATARTAVTVLSSRAARSDPDAKKGRPLRLVTD